VHQVGFYYTEMYAVFYSYINKKEIMKINTCHPCMVDSLLCWWVSDTMNQSLNCRDMFEQTYPLEHQRCRSR
jgi:hypothetical protein